MTLARQPWKGLAPFSATGIGSLPFLSPEQACHEILSRHELIPFWPQLVRLNPREEMLIQYSPPLPCLEPDLKNKGLVYDPSCDRSQALLLFYEKLLAPDDSFFALRPDFAAGFYTLLKQLPALRPQPTHVKGQIVGPVTLGLGVQLEGHRFLIHDAELMEAVIKGLAAQAGYQRQRITALGMKAVLFLDEPSLSGYGSAFTPLSRDEVLSILGQTISLIREQGEVLIGLHCCGNTDWSLLLSLDVDILNLDAYGFGESFLLYPKEIDRFLRQDKAVAWGIVPTSDNSGHESALSLLDRLSHYFDGLIQKGVNRDLLIRQALVTPACGMGLLTEETSKTLLSLLSEVSLRAREKFL